MEPIDNQLASDDPVFAARIARFKDALLSSGLGPTVPRGSPAGDYATAADEIRAFTQWKDSNPRPWNNWKDFTNFKDWESCGY